MKIHNLKTWPEFFDVVKSGIKPFEMRENDRNYQVGDYLNLLEYIPETKQFTGDNTFRKVTYILDKQPFVPEKYVCMGIEIAPKLVICNSANKEADGKCFGYCRDDNDDEPIEICKNCPRCTCYEE